MAHPNPSTIIIPLSIEKEELGQAINAHLQDTLFEELTAGWHVTVRKDGPIEFGLKDFQVQYRVPLHAAIRRGTWVGELAAQGQATLAFSSQFEILPDWTVQVKTGLEHFEWKDKPRAGIGFAKVPVKWLGDFILNRSRHLVASVVNEQLEERMQLRPLVKDAWQELAQVRQIDGDRDLWLQLQPQDLAMGPVQEQEDRWSTQLLITALCRLSMGAAPAQSDTLPVPEFTLLSEQHQSGWQTILPLHMSWAAAEKMGGEGVVRQTFRKGRYEVRVDSLQLFPTDDERLGVRLQLSGSYEGQLFFDARPYFNSREQILSFADIRLRLQSNRFWHKTLAWLGRRRIKKELEQRLVFDLKERLEMAREELTAYLGHQEIREGVVVKADFSDLSFEAIHLGTRGIDMELRSRGHIQVEVAPTPP